MLTKTYIIYWLCPVWHSSTPPPSSWPQCRRPSSASGPRSPPTPCSSQSRPLPSARGGSCSKHSTPSSSLVLLVTTKLLVIVLLHKVCNIDFSLLSTQHSSLLYKLRSSYLEETFSCFGSITSGSFFHYH